MNISIVKIINSTLFKIVTGLVLCIGFVILVQFSASKIFGIIHFPQGIEKLITALITASTVIILYVTLYKIYERRKITELSLKNLVRNSLLGMILGFILQTAVIVVI